MTGWIYGIQSGVYIKVGKADDIAARMQTFRLHNPHQLKLILKREVIDPFWIESKMHEILEDFAIGREWFRCAPIDVKEAFVVATEEFAAQVKRTASRAEMGIERGKGQPQQDS